MRASGRESLQDTPKTYHPRITPITPAALRYLAVYHHTTYRLETSTTMVVTKRERIRLKNIGTMLFPQIRKSRFA